MDNEELGEPGTVKVVVGDCVCRENRTVTLTAL